MSFTGFLPVWILIVSFSTSVKCDFGITNVLNNIGGWLGDTYTAGKCKLTECCNHGHIYADIDKLEEMLKEHLYGQEIAQSIIISSLRGHINSADPPKALTLSFHGPPGTGKTYVAQMIAKSLYKKGTESRFYHFFNGRSDFPLEKEVETYKAQLRDTITNSLTDCETSMFVFDEVDKIPEGLLNVLVPFLDYNTWHKPWKYSNKVMDSKKAIYIFLSNTGSTQIVQRLLSLWQEGKQRHATKLQDFEHLISIGAFNENGGFYRSDTIETNLIDHYVPFLPLEERHVKKCSEKAFQNRGVMPTKDMTDEVMSHVTFGPSPHNLYSIAGCKRLEQKVAAIIYSHRKSTEL